MFSAGIEFGIGLASFGQRFAECPFRQTKEIPYDSSRVAIDSQTSHALLSHPGGDSFRSASGRREHVGGGVIAAREHEIDQIVEGEAHARMR